MSIELTGLRGLCSAMRRAAITRYKWRFERGPATFEAIFIIEAEPFELLLGAIGSNFGITLLVQPGFRVATTVSPENYHALCQVLQLEYDPNRKFKPSDFLADLNRSIPQTVNLTTGRVRPHDVLRHRKNVDTSDGKYFCGWWDNTPLGRHVQSANLQKTLQAFGQRVYEFCRDHNISSRWTHDESLARDYSEPSAQ